MFAKPQTQAFAGLVWRCLLAATITGLGSAGLLMIGVLLLA